MWGATLSTVLIEFDTNTNSLVTTHNHAAFSVNYGVALGRDALDNTRVYLGSNGGLRSYIEYI